MKSNLWSDALFQESAIVVLGLILVFGLIFYFFRNRNQILQLTWQSLLNWLFTAPIIFVVLALPSNWTLFFLMILSIFSAKIFFQMVGIYHRSWFVWSCYLAIVGLWWSLKTQQPDLYQTMPMLLLGCITLIPLLRNSYANMVQYISLTLLSFLLMGWALMHLGKIFMWDRGPLVLLYIIIVTEVSDNIFLVASRGFPQLCPWNKISPRRSLSGFFIAFAASLGLAWGLRHLLPENQSMIWLTSGVICSLAGGLGDMTISVIRRDLGIRDVSGFILGRGNLIDLLDRLIFVAPIYYYVMNPWLG